VHSSWRRIVKSVLVVLTLLVVGACGTREVPLSEVAPDDLWSQGVEQFEQERWSEAIRFLERFIIVGGADPRVHQARYYVAEAHFNRSEYVTAATLFSGLAADLGRSDMGELARFMSCRSYEELAPPAQRDQEYTRAAIDHCQSVVDLFPGGEYSEQAREIVTRMWERLAEKAFDGGDWYQGRRAYDSAIIYFEDVVRLYPRTSYAPRALRRMIDIYEVLEYDQELEETRARLLRDYPDSPEARRLAGSDG
jgi:outer membrane protein assembly factor BamD